MKLPAFQEKKIKGCVPIWKNYKLELGGKLMVSVAITKLNEIEDLDEKILLEELNSQKEIEYFFIDSGRYKNPTTFKSFSEYFQLLDDIAKRHKIERVIGITSNYLPSNYFSESDYRGTSIIGTYDWNKIYAPPSVTVYLIFQIVAQSLVLFGKEDIYHRETRGCIFDYKMNKEDIYLSLKSGLICDDCKNELKNKIPEKYIEAAERILKNSVVGEKVVIDFESKPHIFVAMPFSQDMDDVYFYGIQKPVIDEGYVCERIDLTSFTGGILDQIKKRIETASLVIAELSGANPNVYLEVGYAWGKNCPTVLLVKKSENLPFDVKSQRCLKYERIIDLEKSLKKELKALKSKK